MIKNLDLYYFSPTGATLKAGRALAEAMAEEVNAVDLGVPGPAAQGQSETAVFAVPVFAGRVPEVVSQKIRNMSGSGKKAVTVVVYGVRAYEDALLELNDVVKEAGFVIAGSAAAVSRHSVVTFVGGGRPDAEDMEEIREFGRKVLDKIAEGSFPAFDVPGNRPYRDGAVFTITPLCTPECGGCGECIKSCPVDAMSLEDGKVITDVEKCILCVACTAACPKNARKVPDAFRETMNGKLGHLKDLRRENEFYL